MENIFSERLKKLRKEKDVTAPNLADTLEIDKSTISRYENGLTEPNLQNLIKISQFFDVSIDWLAGISNIKESYITPSQILKLYNSLSESKKREAFRYLQYLKNSNFEFETKETIKILGQTAAGKPLEYGDSYAQDVDDVLTVPKGADYALKVNGDSMEPTIKNGQIIYIKQTPDVENGEIAVVEIDGAVTCKKVYKWSEHIELHSINTAYEPIIIKSGDFKILGKVIL